MKSMSHRLKGRISFKTLVCAACWLLLGLQPCQAASKLYWTSRGTGKIQRANLDGTQIEDIVTGLSGGNYGLAIDELHGQIFWSDASQKTISRANLDGSGKQTIVTGLTVPLTIGLDPAADFMYWVDNDKIKRATLSGGNVVTLATVPDAATGLALDLINQKIYESDLTGHIQRSNLDGTGVLLLPSRYGTEGLAVDGLHSHLYLANFYQGTIARTALNGAGYQLLVSGLNGPEQLALDLSAGKMYWNEYSSGRIRRANLDGTGVQTVIIGVPGVDTVRLMLDVVPEPSTTALAGLAIALFVRRRRYVGANCRGPLPLARSAGMFLVFIASSLNEASAEPAFFMGLGDLPGGAYRSEPWDVSADGSVVVGSSYIGNYASNPAFPIREAFRWTRGSGMVGLGLIGTESEAKAISADGSVIVGLAGEYLLSAGPRIAFRWTSGAGLVALPELTGNYDATAYDVSADGSAVGLSNLPTLARGTRWTDGQGAEDLSTLLGLNYFRVDAVTPDGSTMAGFDYDSDTPFLWRQSVGTQHLPAGGGFFYIESISADGSTIVGFHPKGSTSEAWTWSQATGFASLPPTDSGYAPTQAFDVTADGSTIVGIGFNGSGVTAVIWDAVHGSRGLQQLLISDYGLGADLAGWDLRTARAISADERTIVGAGFNPQGLYESWTAYLGSAVPEPGAFALSALALIPTAWRRRDDRKRSQSQKDGSPR